MFRTRLAALALSSGLVLTSGCFTMGECNPFARWRNNRNPTPTTTTYPVTAGDCACQHGAAFPGGVEGPVLAGPEAGLPYGAPVMAGPQGPVMPAPTLPQPGMQGPIYPAPQTPQGQPPRIIPVPQAQPMPIQ